MNRKAPYRMGIGVSSLLLILVVISMTTLSVLALLSASSDLKLSNKRQEYVVAQATADSKLKEALFLLNEGAKPENLGIEGVRIEKTDENWTVYVPFFENMCVMAEVSLSSQGLKENSYEVVNTGKWQPNEILNLPH